MAKQSAFAAAVNREVKRQIAEQTRSRMQLAQDAAFIAANEVLGLGAGRAREFGEAFCRACNEIADQRGAEAATMKRNRKDAKYSRARLARNAGVSEQSLYSYETGLREPGLSAMQKLSAALGMTIDEYIGFAPKNY